MFMLEVVIGAVLTFLRQPEQALAWMIKKSSVAFTILHKRAKRSRFGASRIGCKNVQLLASSIVLLTAVFWRKSTPCVSQADCVSIYPSVGAALRNDFLGMKVFPAGCHWSSCRFVFHHPLGFFSRRFFFTKLKSMVVLRTQRKLLLLKCRFHVDQVLWKYIPRADWSHLLCAVVARPSMDLFEAFLEVASEAVILRWSRIVRKLTLALLWGEQFIIYSGLTQYVVDWPRDPSKPRKKRWNDCIDAAGRWGSPNSWSW